MLKYFGAFTVFIFLISCENKPETMFTRLSADKTGIDFRNDISESDSFSILTFEYIYNGAGVGIADFNNDGLSDILFSGNQVPPRLYINKGELKFEDISKEAGLTNFGKWFSGVAIADVNGDGFLDVYMCATMSKDSIKRKNALLINQGTDNGKRVTFKDEAHEYKLDYSGYSTNAAFLDYDNDNDLDLYIITNTIQAGIPTSFRTKINDGSSINTDKLFRNNGDKTFTDVSRDANIVHEGYGLGIAICDINKDGWQDIYVSNDYITNDLLYVNNHDGTFTNAIDSLIKHQSQFSMGNDVADINNDALVDIVTLDMLPENNLRRKTVIHAPTYSAYINNERYNYSHQYTRNMLQLNNGAGKFSEIGQLSGIHQTEWSWSPLFADFNNDGYKDLLITNGFPRDITDKDFANFRNDAGGALASNEILLDSIPVVKIANYAYVNNKDLTFKDVTTEWGMTDRSFSNGAAFADLDNDGDLDYIVNNINDEAFVYRNNLMDEKNKEGANYLRIKLKGPAGNTEAFGTKITLFSGQGLQYHDHSVYRGYLSSVEPIVHFGLGNEPKVDSLIFTWPDGKTTVFKNIKANQVLTADYSTVSKTSSGSSVNTVHPLFKNINRETKIQIVPPETDRIDFNVQRTLPHKFSQAGPGLAVGDANGDGLEDFYVGGASGYEGLLCIQSVDGTFRYKTIAKSKMKLEEDMGSLFFDADNDGDEDLYVVSGSFEFAADSPEYQDRLYINDGHGKLSLAEKNLPNTTASGSCVRGADFDGDGDIDLFVGGRVVPAAYPIAPRSYLLINDHGTFTDQTPDDLKYIGMVTDALWTEINGDNRIDLLVVGEFMAPVAFAGSDKGLVKMANESLNEQPGWWNSICPGDFDADGDIDYVIGNLGLNNFYKASKATPLRVYAKDFDGNNSVDAILTCYLKSESGDLKEYPVHFLDEMNSQSPKFRRRFKYYKQFGKAELNSVLLQEDLEGAVILEATNTATSYFENKGDGTFNVRQMPKQVQIAPVNGMVSYDVDDDGDLDILLTGNDFGNEVFTGRHDAFNGSVLLNDGNGNFTALPQTESGFIVQGDGKALAKIWVKERPLLAVTQNRDSVLMFTNSSNRIKTFVPDDDDLFAEFKFDNGKTLKVECYWGSGYLAQSSRKILWPTGAVRVDVTDKSGKKRTISQR